MPAGQLFAAAHLRFGLGLPGASGKTSLLLQLRLAELARQELATLESWRSHASFVPLVFSAL